MERGVHRHILDQKKLVPRAKLALRLDRFPRLDGLLSTERRNHDQDGAEDTGASAPSDGDPTGDNTHARPPDSNATHIRQRRVRQEQQPHRQYLSSPRPSFLPPPEGGSPQVVINILTDILPRPQSQFYKTFTRPVAKVLLMALLTYQLIYWSWLKLETDEIRAERDGESSRCRRRG